MVYVDLTDKELCVANVIGTMRQAAMQLSSEHAALYVNHIAGAFGEMAVAKALNLYWDCSVNTFKARGDVGDLEVRTTPQVPPNSCHLYVSKKDHDDRKFILVSQINRNKYQLHGWMKGSEVKQRGMFKSLKQGKPPQYWISYELLHPMYTLSELVWKLQSDALDEIADKNDQDF